MNMDSIICNSMVWLNSCVSYWIRVVFKCVSKKYVLRPITTEANSNMNQSEFLTITCNLLKGWKKKDCAYYEWFVLILVVVGTRF